MDAGTATGISVGTFVRHPQKREWGLGKVLGLEGTTAAVYFRDYPEEKPGDAVRKIRIDLVQLVRAEVQSDPWLDNLPPLQKGTLGLSKPRLTLQQAIAYFHRKFPLGFQDLAYIGDRTTGERAYKYRHHLLYLELFGNGEGLRLLADEDLDELVRRAYRMFSINLLHTQEQIKVREGLLLNRPAAGNFFRCLFALIDSPGVDRNAFEKYLDSVRELEVIPGKRVASWPTATVIPFLADPTRFMFLKPEPTKQAADRLAFDLDYSSTPNWRTYERLLRMSSVLMESLRPLGAQDWLDVQSFMWVISEH